MIRYFFYLLCFSLLMSQTPLQEREKVKEATVSVTAEIAAVDLMKTPAVVRVISSTELKRLNITTLAQVLSVYLPGQVLSAGGMGSASTLRIAGSRPDDVAILINGVRYYDAAGLGAANPNSLSIVGVDRVEITQGSASTLFGSGAMGGVIAIYTSGQSEPKRYDRWRLSQNSIGGRSLEGSSSRPWDSGWVQGNFQLLSEPSITPTNRPYRSVASHLGFGQKIAQGLLNIDYRNYYQGAPVPYVSSGLGTGVRPESAYSATREFSLRNEQLSMTYRSEPFDGVSTVVSLGSNNQDRLEPRFMESGFDPYVSRRTQGGLEASKRFNDQWSGSSRFEWFNESGTTPAYPTGKDQGLASHWSGVLETGWEPRQTIRIVASIRSQHDVQTFRTATSNLSIVDRKAQSMAWKTGVTVLPEALGGSTRIFASLGAGFSVPALTSSLYHASNILDPSSFSYNPESYRALNNERSRFYQLGFSHQQGAWEFKIDASRNTYDSLVFFDLNTYDYANGQNIRVQGIQTTIFYHGEEWHVEIFHRNQEAREMDASIQQPLQTSATIRRPFNSGGILIRFEQGLYTFGLQGSYIGPRYENFGGYPATLAAYRQHFNDLNCTVTRSVSQGKVTLRLEHLLQPTVSKSDWINRRYDFTNDAQMIYGFPAPEPRIGLEYAIAF